jgi:hypothetical protein
MVSEFGVDLKSLSNDMTKCLVMTKCHGMTDPIWQNWKKLHDYHDDRKRELSFLIEELEASNRDVSGKHSKFMF